MSCPAVAVVHLDDESTGVVQVRGKRGKDSRYLVDPEIVDALLEEDYVEVRAQRIEDSAVPHSSDYELVWAG